MKILFIGAGTSNHTKRWVNALAKNGHTVLLVSRPDQQVDEKELDPNVSVRYLRFGGKSVSYYLNAPELRRIYRSFRPDVTNAHYVSGYGTLARTAGIRNLVVSCWGSDVYAFPYQSKLNLHIVRKNMNYADAIACTSEAMALQVRRLLNDESREIAVTPFGVDTELFCPAPAEKTRPVIGIVKYLEPIYDVELLIRAFAIVYQQARVKPLLSIYGDGSLRIGLERLAEELGIADSVCFFGTIPNREVPKALNTFDIFVNCSKQESFGVAVVEAMACGIPVVVTNTEGFREVVADQETGIVLSDRNPNTMADAITTLLHDEALRKRMGENGRKRVLGLYDWSENVTVMEKLYEKVTDNVKE